MKTTVALLALLALSVADEAKCKCKSGPVVPGMNIVPSPASAAKETITTIETTEQGCCDAANAVTSVISWTFFPSGKCELFHPPHGVKLIEEKSAPSEHDPPISCPPHVSPPSPTCKCHMMHGVNYVVVPASKFQESTTIIKHANPEICCEKAEAIKADAWTYFPGSKTCEIIHLAAGAKLREEKSAPSEHMPPVSCGPKAPINPPHPHPHHGQCRCKPELDYSVKVEPASLAKEVTVVTSQPNAEKCCDEADSKGQSFWEYNLITKQCIVFKSDYRVEYSIQHVADSVHKVMACKEVCDCKVENSISIKVIPSSAYHQVAKEIHGIHEANCCVESQKLPYKVAAWTYFPDQKKCVIYKEDKDVKYETEFSVPSQGLPPRSCLKKPPTLPCECNIKHHVRYIAEPKEKGEILQFKNFDQEKCCEKSKQLGGAAWTILQKFGLCQILKIPADGSVKIKEIPVAIAENAESCLTPSMAALVAPMETETVLI